MRLLDPAAQRRRPPCVAPDSRGRRVRLLQLVALAIGLVCVLSGQAAAQADTPVTTEAAAGGRRMLLPLVFRSTGAVYTGASYVSIPVQLPPTDRPAAAHPDLNLAVRGYAGTAATLGLVWYGGDTDGDAPQMPGLFSDGRTPQFTSAYRVYDWNWSCGANGCRSGLLSSPEVTLLGMGTRPGELIAFPARGREIYGGGYVALVLYADETRITLKYTRNDNVVAGYTVHIENLDIDTNLLALYRQDDARGRKELPAVRNGQPIGIAGSGEIRVAIRDCGAFLDPRSRKDWWQGR